MTLQPLAADQTQLDTEAAQQAVDQFVADHGHDNAYRLLAYYAAVPLLLTPELLNYLRNRFLRGQTSWVAEIDLLLNANLCRPVDYELYALRPAVRSYLLAEMRRTVGLGEMQRVAQILLHYVRHLAHTNQFLGSAELQSQQWAAMVYLDDQRPTVVREIAEHFEAVARQLAGRAPGLAAQQPGRAELARLARITALLAPELAQYPAIVEYAALMRQLLAGEPVMAEARQADYQTSVAGVRLRVPESLRGGHRALDFDWVTIPAGAFLMGSDQGQDRRARNDELPQHTLTLPAFRIARVPVTNRQYKVFVAATGHNKPGYWNSDGPPAEKADHPVVDVTWQDARAFCRWAGVRLPTEAEWEKAARGADGRIYPWGNNRPTKELCNFNGNVGDTTPVGRYPQGASPAGLLDMAGNVWEWTSSRHKPYPYSADDGREDPEAEALRTLRGGSWYFNVNLVRCAVRLRFDPDVGLNTVGFRVVSPGF